jgi:hypothetical protein
LATVPFALVARWLVDEFPVCARRLGDTALELVFRAFKRLPGGGQSAACNQLKGQIEK